MSAMSAPAYRLEAPRPRPPPLPIRTKLPIRNSQILGQKDASDTLLYDLPSPTPVSPTRITSPTSPTSPYSPRSSSARRASKMMSPKNPSRPMQSELEEFAEHCRECEECRKATLANLIPPAHKRRNPASNPKQQARSELTQCQTCWKSKADGAVLFKCSACKVDLYCVS